MKLSSDPTHPDYHDVVAFIDKVYCDKAELTSCVHIDIANGLAQCITYPIAPVNGVIPTHTIKGAITFTWRETVRSQNKLLGSGVYELFTKLRANWQAREDGNGA